MFRSLMTIIRELYLNLTKVMLKHSVKLRRCIYMVMWQHVVERYVLSYSAQHTTYMLLYDMLPHHQIYITT